MNTIDLTPHDLAANQRGIASPHQLVLLRRVRLAWSVGLVGCVLLVMCIVGVVILKMRDPAFASQGQLWIVLPLLALWLWLLRQAPQQWWRTSLDIREGRIIQVEGVAHGDFSSGIGLVHVLKYQIRIGAQRFSVQKDAFWSIRQGESYRIYYALRSKTFLGAVRLIALPEARELESFSSTIPTLIEPLTVQEQDILRLIAAGLSNKEIAVQRSLSVNTIKMYASQIYRKLGVSRRTEAVSLARQLQLLP